LFSVPSGQLEDVKKRLTMNKQKAFLIGKVTPKQNKAIYINTHKP